jgi:hypothetical protein
MPILSEENEQEQKGELRLRWLLLLLIGALVSTLTLLISMWRVIEVRAGDHGLACGTITHVEPIGPTTGREARDARVLGPGRRGYVWDWPLSNRRRDLPIILVNSFQEGPVARQSLWQ